MASRLLITGVGGCTGRHLVEHLRKRGAWHLVGTGRQPTCALPLDDYVSGDLNDAEALDSVVRRARPDIVVHLAAVTGPDPSVESQNLDAFENLCAGLRRHASIGTVRLVTIGSAAELGSAGVRTLPVTEDAVCEPETPYGRGKLAITRRALSEPTDSPLQVVIARTCNLIGPGLGTHLALGNFARQIVAIERGEATTLRCGALETRRDVLDVRDAAAAYAALLTAGDPRQVYNVCRGASWRIGDLLSRLIARAAVEIPIEASDARRAGDVADVYGDPSKLSQATSWRPEISIEQSLVDMLDEARQTFVSPQKSRTDAAGVAP